MAATTTDDTAVFTIKLVVDTRYRMVLFAKTTSDVVYFLESLLNLPDSPVSLDDLTFDGCTDNIVSSAEEVERLEDEAEAEDLGEDTPPSPPPPPPPEQQQQARRRFFVCGGKRGAGCDDYLAERSDARCPSCGWLMDAEAPRDSPGAGCSGDAAPPPSAAAAAGALTCTLMDDLSIGLHPDAIIGIEIMKGASDAAFQEETVRLGHKEGLEILKASLESSTVLTDVFLRDKAPAAGAPI
ncbi:unnamed protein product [Urochloa decumbens]|uniref:Uncharacterized protein n=1 Tax=Urochloa decumbens TaxID=240449 RepID=A0ABC8Z0H8_9POAL